MSDAWRNIGLSLEHATLEAGLWAFVALEICALLSVPSVLLRRRGRPTSALAWLLALLALPAIGSVAWWAIGRTRMERRLRQRSKKKRDFIEVHGTPSKEATDVFKNLLPERARTDYAFASVGNAVELLADGPNAYPALRESLGKASQSIHLLFYIFELDATGVSICELLIKKAKEGILVRLLLDGLGSQKTWHRLKKLLEPHGVQVAVFLPSRIWPLYAPRFNFINHRKIVVIDNRVAFTGGMNIGADYENSWRDLMLKLQGPAVEGLNHIFLEDWYFASGDDIPDPLRGAHECRSDGTDIAVVSSGPDTEGWIHDAYFLAITQAKSKVVIATPYFIPTAGLLTALRTAAGRGVEVSIVVPSLSDVKIVKWASRSFYPLLVDVGVRIFEYSANMLHAKAMVVDDKILSVGTANIDNRSLRLNFEVSCFLSDEKMAKDLSTWLAHLLKESTEMTPEFLEKKGIPRKLLESAAHLLSPLL